MDNIIQFPNSEHVVSEGTDFPVEPARVLEGAMLADLSPVLVIGRKREDGEFYFASDTGNMGKLLVMLERAKKMIVEAIE